MASLRRVSPYRSPQRPRERTNALHPLDQLRLQLLATELAGADVQLRAVDGSRSSRLAVPRAAAGLAGAAESRTRQGRTLEGQTWEDQTWEGRGPEVTPQALRPTLPLRAAMAETPSVPIVIPAGTIMDPGTGGREAMGGLVLSALRGRPVAGVGLAAAPAAGTLDRALARQFASRSRLLVMRSEAAARRLALAGASAPIRVGADLAWLQPTVASRPERAPQVLVIGDPPDAFVARALAGALPTAVGESVGVVLGHWDGWADRRLLMEALAGRLPVSRLEVLPAWSDATEGLAIAARSLAVVALDVDAQLIAALTRTPAVVISDDEECLALADELGHPVLPPAASGRHLRDALGDAIATGWLGAAGVEGFRERARSSVDLLRLVISADDTASTPAQPDPTLAGGPVAPLAGPEAGAMAPAAARRNLGALRDVSLWPEPSAR